MKTMRFLNVTQILASRLFRPVYAHCDTEDGPVARAARFTLAQRDVHHALIWVRPEDEATILAAYAQAESGLEAAEAARQDDIERSFIEQLVKVHRQGEGETYEGIQPPGSNDPAIDMADRAVDSGSLDEVFSHIDSPQTREKVQQHFDALKRLAGYDIHDVPAGRRYVHAYAHFIHLVEHLVHGDDEPVHNSHA